MKTVTVQMSKPGLLPRLISKIFLQKNNLIILASAFLIAGSGISGTIPLGSVFFAASCGTAVSKLLTAAAVILGTVLHGSPELIYLNTGCILLFFMLSLPIRGSNSKINAKAALAAFLSVLVPQFILALLHGLLLYDVFKALFCSFIAFVFYVIFRFSIPVMTGMVKKALLDGEEAVSAGITAALAVSGLGTFQVLGFSLRNILCVVLVLFFSYRCSAGAGAATGAVTGLIISASSEFTPSIAGTYALCGMLAGILGNIGRAGAALGFILGNMVLAIYFNGAAESMLYLRDVLAAAAIFFIVPEKLADRLTSPFIMRNALIEDRNGYFRRVRELTAERLRKFAAAYMELSKTFGEIANTKIPSERHDINVLFDRVADRICRDCSLNMHCWERSFYDTYQVMFRIVESLEMKGRVDENDIPVYFVEKCPRISDFVNTVNNMYELFKVDMVWKSRIDESRAVISRQFEGMSRVIKSLADEINTDIIFMAPLEEAVTEALRREGINAEEVIVYKGLWGKYEISLLHSSCRGSGKCAEIIGRVVSEAVGRKMIRSGEGCGRYTDGKCRLKYIEAENLKITAGIARIPKYGSKVSGDSFTFTESGNGKYTLALSDGMGSGSSASAQSKAAVTMLENFLESGFDKEMAVSLINSVLVLKSEGDNTCTLDISMIDMHSGEVEFIKIGAAPTYIRREFGVEIIRAATLPAGILPGVDAELAHKNMDSGDMIIMVTDGIIDSMGGDEPGDRVLLKFIQQLDSLNPQQVAESIMAEAVKCCDGKPFDDMTVLVAKAWKKAI